MGPVSYYAERSARDPDWRAEQLREAAERDRRRRELDPDGYLQARRETARRARARQRAQGLTFQELLDRSPVNDPAVLAFVLRDEVRLGRIEYRSTSRRYLLNGGLPADVKAALRNL
jgi:hypothetical protein